MKIKQASGFAVEVFHYRNRFLRNPAGTSFSIRWKLGRKSLNFRTRNYGLQTKIQFHSTSLSLCLQQVYISHRSSTHNFLSHGSLEN